MATLLTGRCSNWLACTQATPNCCEQLDEVCRCHGLRQLSDDSAAADDTVGHLLLTEEAGILQRHLLGNLVVHAAQGIVHVGVHGHHSDIMLDGFHHGTLHVVASVDALQGMENQRMMAHNEVTTLGNGLVDHLLGYVKTQQCP